MFATDIFDHSIYVELANIFPPLNVAPSDMPSPDMDPPGMAPSWHDPLLTWSLTPRALLSLMFATDIFGHGIDVELANISSPSQCVPLLTWPPPDMAPSWHGPLLTWSLTPRVLLSLMFATDIFGHGIDVELTNISFHSQCVPLQTWPSFDMAPSWHDPLLTWSLTPRALLSLMFATDIFGHGIDVELTNISFHSQCVPLQTWPSFDMAPSWHGPLLTWSLTPRALLSLMFATEHLAMALM